MTATASPPMYLQFFDPNNSGSPLVGGLLFTYLASTSTKTPTWTDSTQSVQNSNPIVLDSNGAAYVWLDSSVTYKFVLSPKNDTDPPASPIRTKDNISGAYTGVVEWTQIKYDQTPAESAASVTPTNYARPFCYARRFGAVGDGVTDDTAAIQLAINSLKSLSRKGGDIIFDSAGNTTATFMATALDLHSTIGIRFIGEGNGSTGGAAPAVTLQLNANAGTRIIDARSTAGFWIENLLVLHQGSAFTGNIVDYDGGPLASDSFYGGTRHCLFNSNATGATHINLNKTHSMDFELAAFLNGGVALAGGGANYANRINVKGCTFSGQTTIPIKDPTGTNGQTWTVHGNTFEPLASGNAGALLSSVRVSGLDWKGNWCGDANAAGTWVSMAAGDGCDFGGGSLFSAGAKGIAFTGAVANAGNKISACVFSSITTAVDISAASSWFGVVDPNLYTSVTNRLVGTPTFGRFSDVAGTTYYGPSLFDASYANGVGAGVSGTNWGVAITNSGNKGMAVKAASGQTADLLQWQDNSGNDTGAWIPGASGSIYRWVKSTDPAAPAANKGYLYMRDNGAGKMQIVARFPTGAIQVIATEP